MARRLWRSCLLKVGAAVALIYISVTLVLLLYTPPQEQCDCPKAKLVDTQVQEPAAEVQDDSKTRHKLAVVVPFRDRFDELLQFAPHMHKYLNEQNVEHEIYVINQVDHLRFNRAVLINIGFLQSQSECDYIAMHDVDLLPVSPGLSYAYPEKGAFHVSAPNLHPQYHYKDFVGGILILSNEDFKKVNGLTTRFWGWGREDDEFFVRMKEAGIKVIRPRNITTGYSTFKHIHNKWRRPRDNYRYWSQKADTRHRDRITGITTVQYTVASIRQVTIDGTPVKLINVELECDYKDTPWCVTPDQLQKLIDGGVVEESIYGDLSDKMGLSEQQLKALIEKNKRKHR